MTSLPLILRQAELGPMANFVYLIGCPETREAAVVDPAWDVPKILRMAGADDLAIRYILLTHGHPDHVNGVKALIEATGARVYLHRDEVDYTRQAADLFGFSVDFLGNRPQAFKATEDDETILVGKVPLRFLHTPGHTPGSQCFLIEGNLVSGDTLFINACGRVDLPGGDPEKMWWSLNRRLAALADETILYPGHNYSDRPVSTLAAERRTNPYMQFATAQRFVEVMSGF